MMGRIWGGGDSGYHTKTNVFRVIHLLKLNLYVAITLVLNKKNIVAIWKFQKPFWLQQRRNVDTTDWIVTLALAG